MGELHKSKYLSFLMDSISVTPNDEKLSSAVTKDYDI